MRRRGGFWLRVGVLALVGLAACIGPRGLRSPATLEEAAEVAPEGQARASIHLVVRASAAQAEGNLGRARELASRALRIDGRNAYAYLLLGEVSGSSGEVDAALRYLDEAARLFASERPPNELWLTRALQHQVELLEQIGEEGRAEYLRERAESVGSHGR